MQKLVKKNSKKKQNNVYFNVINNTFTYNNYLSITLPAQKKEIIATNSEP